MNLWSRLTRMFHSEGEMPNSSGSVQELQKQLLQAVGNRISKLGFSQRPVGQSFYRPARAGRAALHLGFINRLTDFDVTADVAVRIDAVEDLVNSDAPGLSAKEKGRTFTLGAELGNLGDGRQRRWTVSNINHVDSVARGIVEYFESVGVPFIERCSNLEAVLYVLAGHDKEAWLYAPIHGHRCKTVAALARILGDADRFDRVVMNCEEFLRSRNDPDLSTFQAFVTTLRDGTH
jgi:hypothetical protein